MNPPRILPIPPSPFGFWYPSKHQNFVFFCVNCITAVISFIDHWIDIFQAEKEPILSSFLYASVLSHDSLERTLGFVLANRLQNPTLLATQLMDTFCEVIMNDRGIQRSIRLDMQVLHNSFH